MLGSRLTRVVYTYLIIYFGEYAQLENLVWYVSFLIAAYARLPVCAPDSFSLRSLVVSESCLSRVAHLLLVVNIILMTARSFV